MIEELTEQLREHEGYREVPYYDSLGVLTVGFGHNLLVSPLNNEQMREYFSCGFPRDRLHFFDKIFKQDIIVVIENTNKALPWVTSMPENVRMGLYNMAFQMGVSGLLKFSKSLHLIQAQKWEAAAKELRNSKWVKQTPKRSREVIYTITGITI
jgi:lysozyme